MDNKPQSELFNKTGSEKLNPNKYTVESLIEQSGLYSSPELIDATKAIINGLNKPQRRKSATATRMD